ncbi:hypothetical protein [Streptomyces sp. R02]|uniref:DUF397 domain-containing protein n=1 Tax=Streptomyces sp. R02 TaxID=3238623 RepID=A0AB39LGC0_9ACTN
MPLSHHHVRTTVDACPLGDRPRTGLFFPTRVWSGELRSETGRPA